MRRGEIRTVFRPEALNALDPLHLIPDGQENYHESNVYCRCRPEMTVFKGSGETLGALCNHQPIQESTE